MLANATILLVSKIVYKAFADNRSLVNLPDND